MSIGKKHQDAQPRPQEPKHKQGATVEEDRGPHARKVELEKRLDANAELERESAKRDKNGDRSENDATDEELDEALKDSFPASDPPARTSPIRSAHKGK